MPISLRSEFGDERLDRRCDQIRTMAAARPGLSFPRMVRTEGQREALYRFLGNDRVTMEAMLEPHIEATARRMSEHAVVLAVHDTTEFSFAGEVQRPGLGMLPNG